MQRQSKAEIYLHFVWATYGRAPLIEGSLRRSVYRGIVSVARNIGCGVLALGGIADHVHLLLRAPATLRPCDIARRIKTNSTRLVRDTVKGHGGFAWQGGYGVFSVGRTQVDAVAGYVEQQGEHHRGGDVWAEWEEVDEEAPSGCDAGGSVDGGW